MDGHVKIRLKRNLWWGRIDWSKPKHASMREEKSTNERKIHKNEKKKTTWVSNSSMHYISFWEEKLHSPRGYVAPCSRHTYSPLLSSLFHGALSRSLSLSTHNSIYLLPSFHVERIKSNKVLRFVWMHLICSNSYPAKLCAPSNTPDELVSPSSFSSNVTHLPFHLYHARGRPTHKQGRRRVHLGWAPDRTGMRISKLEPAHLVKQAKTIWTFITFWGLSIITWINSY